MNWISLLGLDAWVARWRAAVIELAIAAEDRTDLARLEWVQHKRSMQTVVVLLIALAGNDVLVAGDAGRSRCGRIIATLLQATAHDGRRELRAARAFHDLLWQFAELLQRRPRSSVLRGEVVASAARVSVLLGQ